MTELQSQQAIVARVRGAAVQLVNPFHDTQINDDDFSLAARRISTDSNVISIWGDRGSGKSTLLTGILNDFRRDPRFFVLPPLSPELFGDHDSLLNILLATIQQQMHQIVDNATDEEALTLHRVLQRARRNAAVNSIPMDRLSTHSVSIGEFSREIQDIAGGTEQLWQDVQRLLSAAVRMKAERRAVVVAIDDADLMRPASLVGLIRQARIIGSCHHVIVVLAGKEGEILNRFVRDEQRDAYASAPERREFDLNAEKAAWSAASAQMRKAFPSWSAFNILEPSHFERTNFCPPSSDRPLRNLIAALDGTIHIEDNGNLSDSLCINLAWDRPASTPVVPPAFPGNLRMLAQLWKGLHLSEAQAKQNSTEGLARALSALFSVIESPFGVARPAELALSIDESEVHPPSRLSARINFSGMYGRVRVGEWLNLEEPSGESAPREARIGLKYDLRKCDRHFGMWAISAPTVNDYIDHGGNQSMMLAIQDLLLTGRDVKLDADSEFTYGFPYGAQSFLQLVTIAEQRTDDLFVMFPVTPTLATTIRLADAWNHIASRAEAERLSLRQVLALSLHAVVDVFFDERAASRVAATDYSEALARVQKCGASAVEELGGVASGFGLMEHFLAWYQRLVPNHWHEGIFSREEIGGFCAGLVAASRGTAAAPAPLPAYGERSLHGRLSRAAAKAGAEEAIESSAWMGGYAVAATGLALNLVPTWELIQREWKRVNTARHAGMASVDAPVTASSERGLGDVSGTGYPAGLLVAYAKARLGNWAER